MLREETVDGALCYVIEALPKNDTVRINSGYVKRIIWIRKDNAFAIVSIVERKTGLILIRKVERKTAHAVSQAMDRLLKPYLRKVHTITSENGREFAGHEEIAATLKADFYFAHPYSSWERGINENTNELIRQYFPKNRDFTTITQQEIDTAMERLNNRPRK